MTIVGLLDADGVDQSRERAVIVPHRINDRPADRHADGSTTANSTSHTDHPRTVGGTMRLSVCNDVGCRLWRHRL